VSTVIRWWEIVTWVPHVGGIITAGHRNFAQLRRPTRTNPRPVSIVPFDRMSKLIVPLHIDHFVSEPARNIHEAPRAVPVLQCYRVERETVERRADNASSAMADLFGLIPNRTQAPVRPGRGRVESCWVEPCVPAVLIRPAPIPSGRHDALVGVGADGVAAVRKITTPHKIAWR